MDYNGNVWLPVVGIPKHDTHPSPRKAHLCFRLLKMGYLSIMSAYTCIYLLINESELSGKINAKSEKNKEIKLREVCM